MFSMKPRHLRSHEPQMQQRSENYLEISLWGNRPFKTQSRHHHGKSLSSSMPSNSVIFFLQGPPWEPSVMMEGGETVENSNGGRMLVPWFSKLSSASSLELEWVLMEISFPRGISPLAKAGDPHFFFLLVSQWASRPHRVSWARFICKITGKSMRKRKH